MNLSLKVLVTVVVSFSFLVILTLHQISAQNSTTFMTYRNPALGFTIDYPSDWTPLEDSISNENLTFMIPPANLTHVTSLYDAPLIIHIKEATPYLDADTMTIKNKPVDQMARQMMKNLSEHNPFGLEIKPIRQNQSTVAGVPGWKIEAFLGPETNPLYYFFDVSTVANGKVYHMLYGEKPLKVPETYPIVKRMVDSFRLIPVEPHNTTSLGESNIPTATNDTLGQSGCGPDTTLIPATNECVPATVKCGAGTILNAATNQCDLATTSQTTQPRTFTPEQQDAIDAKCNTSKNIYSTLSVKDRNWYLANC